LLSSWGFLSVLLVEVRDIHVPVVIHLFLIDWMLVGGVACVIGSSSA